MAEAISYGNTIVEQNRNISTTATKRCTVFLISDNLNYNYFSTLSVTRAIELPSIQELDEIVLG